MKSNWLILSASDPRPGDIWRYPYLWHRQSQAGETEGRKDRPTAIVAAVRNQNGDLIIALLPITTKRPPADCAAIEIPPIEARRAGLATEIPLWVILQEFNQDTVGASWYLEPDGRMGSIGPAFLARLTRKFLDHLKNRTTLAIRRTD